MILLPPAGLVVRVEGDGLLRFVANGRVVTAKSATLRVANGVVVGEAGVLAPRVAAGSGPLTIGLDGTLRVGGKVAGRLVLLVNGGLANPGEGLAGVIRSVSPSASPSLESAGQVRVSVRARTILDGDRVRLGDVADLAAAAPLLGRLRDLDLGAAPILGTTRGLSRYYVLASLRRLGIEPQKIELVVPEGAVVERRADVVEAQAILDAALALPEAAGYIPARPPQPLVVPPGELRLSTDPVAIGATARSVTVVATVGGKAVGRRTVELVADPSAPGVKIGDPVRLRLVTGSASVEVSAKARSSARVGGSVTVVSSTGSVHTGVLVTPSLVEVKL